MNFKDKKVAVLVAPGFEDSELTEPVSALRGAGVRVTIIGVSEDDKKAIEGKRGTVVAASALIDEVDATGFDALLIPGGKSPARLRKNERVLDFVRAFDQSGKPIAAICHGPQVLASAGTLEGRIATSYYTVAREVKKAGATYINEPVVIDGSLITSRKPKDIPQFNEAVLASLERVAAR